MRVVVDTAAKAVPLSGSRQRPVIQNLGPDDLFLDNAMDVSPSSGIKIRPGVIYECPTAGAYRTLYMVSSGTSDVRCMSLG